MISGQTGKRLLRPRFHQGSTYQSRAKHSLSATPSKGSTGAYRLRAAIAAGLELLNAIDAGRRLAHHHRLDAVRAHLLELAGDNDPAIAHCRAASARTVSLPARKYLLTPAARLAAMKQ